MMVMLSFQTSDGMVSAKSIDKYTYGHCVDQQWRGSEMDIEVMILLAVQASNCLSPSYIRYMWCIRYSIGINLLCGCFSRCCCCKCTGAEGSIMNPNEAS